MRKLLILIGVCLLLAAAYTYWVFNKPHQDIRNQKASIETSADAMILSFVNDAAAADASLTEKVVLLEGVPSRVNEMEEQTLVTFDMQQDYLVLAYIPSDNLVSGTVSEGIPLKLKCRYAGHIINDEDFLIPADIKFEQCYVQQ